MDKYFPTVILQKLLVCDFDTGRLTWLPRHSEVFDDGYLSAHVKANMWNAQHAGMPAFTTKDKTGYFTGTIFGRGYSAHRVIWALHTGFWPINCIDHINGDKSDNRISNLREATNSQNLCNRGKQSNNTSGFKGVSWNKNRKRWKAQIKLNNKSIHLGLFSVVEDAANAYARAAKQYHKEFTQAHVPANSEEEL